MLQYCRYFRMTRDEPSEDQIEILTDGDKRIIFIFSLISIQKLKKNGSTTIEI